MTLGEDNIVKMIDLDFEIWRRKVLAVGFAEQEFKRNCRNNVYTKKQEQMLKKKFSNARDILHDEDPTVPEHLKSNFNKLFKDNHISRC